jgi:hypothetical protein
MGKPFCCHKSDPNIFVDALDKKSAILPVLLKEMDQNVLFLTVLIVFRSGDSCNTTTALMIRARADKTVHPQTDHGGRT